MATRADFDGWLLDALTELGGRAGIVDVCKHIWNNHERQLRESGDLFYTWQYDTRWAADHLRRKGVMKPATASPKGLWELLKIRSRK